MDRSQIQTKIKDVLDTIFSELGISAEISFPEERNKDDQHFYAEVSTDETNLIIGYHGETLNAIQHVINVILYKDYGDECSAIIDVGGYRREREDKLIALAENASDKAKFLNKSISLHPMNGYERKIIHSRVSELEGVTSSSEGEGYNRRVIITPSSLSPDDGNDIQETE